MGFFKKRLKTNLLVEVVVVVVVVVADVAVVVVVAKINHVLSFPSFI